MQITEEYLRTLIDTLAREERELLENMMVKQGARKACEVMLQRLAEPETEEQA